MKPTATAPQRSSRPGMGPSSAPQPFKARAKASLAGGDPFRRPSLQRSLVLLVVLALVGTPVLAGEVEIFVGETQKGVAKGNLDGVSVDAEGTIELARRVTRIATLEEPFVFSAAGLAEGWAVGTGNSGKVLQVADDGTVETLAILGDLGVFALARDGDHLLAATAPAGKIYRLDPQTGEGEEYFDPEATYVWAMARDADGHLLVATGAPGRLLRITERGGERQSEVLYTSRDGHVRALHVLPDGGVLLGTAGQGLIVHLDAEGEATTVHDAVHPEVLGFTHDDDGRVYAAVLASEASLVDLSGTTSSAGSSTEGEATVAVVEGKTPTVGSRGSGFGEARSLVLALGSDALAGRGGVEEVARFADVTLHSLLWHDGILWLGTGQEGGLFRLTEGGPVAEREVEERQLAAMAAGDDGAVVVTANGSAVYRLESKPVAEGTYTSPTLDAEQVARFGTFRWQGERPRGSEIALAFRSGLSDTPDATWSDWQEVPCGRGTPCATPVGRQYEVPLADLPSGRFVQWRATLEGDASPRIERTELSYRQLNRRPEIEGLEVMDPGAILVPSSFNPQNQTFEPWSPNKDGIFTSLEAALDDDDGRLKTLWKKGYRTLRWEASDPNDDELRYRLEVRPENGWASGKDDEGWLEMVDEHDEDYYSFDATVLPDGVYRFRLTASDRAASGDSAEVLRDDHTSPPVILDHRPPELGAVRRQGSQLRIEISDRLQPLRDAVFSIDAGPWHPATVVDGLLDGRRETLEIPVPTDARVVLVRLTDASFNVVTYEVSSATE